MEPWWLKSLPEAQDDSTFFQILHAQVNRSLRAAAALLKRAERDRQVSGNVGAFGIYTPKKPVYQKKTRFFSTFCLISVLNGAQGAIFFFAFVFPFATAIQEKGVGNSPLLLGWMLPRGGWGFADC